MGTDEIRQFSMKFSKKLGQKPKQEMSHLENRLRVLEAIANFKQNSDDLSSMEKLDSLYEKNGLRIRSKYDWYEHGEK